MLLIQYFFIDHIDQIICILLSACVVMVTVWGNGHGYPSSNPGQGYLHFT